MREDDSNNYADEGDISTEENLKENSKTEPYDSIEDLEDSSRERFEYDNKDVSEKNINDSYEIIEKNNKNITPKSEIDKSKEENKKYINSNEESNERDGLLNRESVKHIPHKIDQNKKDKKNRYEIDESREYDSTKEDLGQSNEHKVGDSKKHKEREQLGDKVSFEKVLPTSEDSLSSDKLENDRHSEDDRNSNETNSESIENFDDFEKTQRVDKGKLGLNNNNNNPIKEQKVEDFSYENLNEISPDSQTTLEKPDTITNSKSSSIVDSTNAKQVKINDDEIKPVIELNNEDSSSQSEEVSKEYRESEEIKPRDEYIKKNLKNIGVKDLLSTSKTLNEDVKSQFERIPENYKHTNAKSDSTEEPPSHKNNDEEGTLDILTPDNHEYDKDLNIKFSDLSIKLPEIKLPKDILAYTHKEGEDDDKDQKRKLEDTEEEQDDEEEEEHHENSKYEGKSKENKDNFYQFYSYPQDEDSSEEPKKKNKGYFNYRDSGEDLYEKFVRERFGKSGNLKSRSEKLINYEPIMQNKNLYQSVQKVLKRTNQIEKEAQDSKDPNYMWTLEYGGKL
ncbi:DNA ligase 1-like [Danaus plexippus]|uniref:DNA ligase 1-like n=1 Tax=Danaus plexippus TaxID=13037 RepID=UPI002AAFA788|nr:DNA ligase 1-like [Danaus plexippus]